jgi:hypothetical protein
MTADLPNHIRHGFVRNPPDHKGTHYFRCLHCGRDKLFAIVVGDELAKVREEFVRDHGSCESQDATPMTVSELIARLQSYPQDSIVLLEVPAPGDSQYEAVRVYSQRRAALDEPADVVISGND